MSRMLAQDSLGVIFCSFWKSSFRRQLLGFKHRLKKLLKIRKALINFGSKLLYSDGETQIDWCKCKFQIFHGTSFKRNFARVKNVNARWVSYSCKAASRPERSYATVPWNSTRIWRLSTKNTPGKQKNPVDKWRSKTKPATYKRGKKWACLN